MAENSAIEWTDATFNPWIGCTKVSPACDHCYAETLSKARLGVPWGAGQPRRRTATSTWKQPLAWNRKAAKEGRRMRVFCASLADVFDAEVAEEWRADLFALIDQTPSLDWLLLTKRPAVARKVMPATPRPNVWLGTTVENQAMAEARIPRLLETPAAVRFLSMEPLLGPVDLTNIPWRFNGCSGETVKTINALTGNITVNDPVFGGGGGVVGLDWVIAGGESGPGARPTHPDWFRSIRDQCAAGGAPFLFKQWGEWAPKRMLGLQCAPGSTWGAINQDGSFSQFATPWNGHDDDGMGDREAVMVRVGKKAAGRLLDGVLHDGYPAQVGEAL